MASPSSRRRVSTSPVSAYSCSVRYTVANPTDEPADARISWNSWAERKSPTEPSASRTARRCLVGRGPGARASVLVIVRSVRRVAMAAVDVVDVVSVLDCEVPAVGTVHVLVRAFVVGDVVAVGED